MKFLLFVEPTNQDNVESNSGRAINWSVSIEVELEKITTCRKNLKLRCKFGKNLYKSYL